MIKNPMLSQDKQAFVDRLNTLTPRCQTQWGKMKVAQMLKHLIELVELANGTRVLPSNTFVSSLIGRLVRNRFINNDRPLPKGLIPVGKPDGLTGSRDAGSRGIEHWNGKSADRVGRAAVADLARDGRHHRP